MRWTTVKALVVLTTHAQLGQAQDTERKATTKQAKTAPELSPELALIQVQSEAFVDAFNKHDAKAVAALWTQDAEYIDDSGAVYTAVHVKVDGQWQMASVRDSWVETLATRESAADLSGLIGFLDSENTLINES